MNRRVVIRMRSLPAVAGCSGTLDTLGVSRLPLLRNRGSVAT